MTQRSISELVEGYARTDARKPALTVDDETVSFAELHARSLRAASALLRAGVEYGATVPIQLPNSIDHVAISLGAWRIGAAPLPLAPGTPPAERAAILEVAGTNLVIDESFSYTDSRPCAAQARVSSVVRVLATGGSSGIPKLIADQRAAVVDVESDRFGWLLGPTLLLPGPLFHSGPSNHLFEGLARGRQVVLTRRFDALQTLRDIEHFRPHFVLLVPTMMHRIMRIVTAAPAVFDVSSVKRMWHTGAYCSPELKEQWINWLGADAIWEVFGGTEGVSSTRISGTEWLEHRGSVGRPWAGEIAILDGQGRRLPVGRLGEIFMRRPDGTSDSSKYVGNPAGRRIIDGWESFGDMGYLDELGYLYLADRRIDMIVTGGENVYPAEVEAAIESHPSVVDCAVFGAPDQDLGERVCAVICIDSSTDEASIREHVAARLVRYKVPRQVIFTNEIVRNEAGKVRRSALRALVTAKKDRE
jgi:bile acid-coenzyme A ligase